jgi:hypothetical protein
MGVPERSPVNDYRIDYPSTIYLHNAAGLARANETLRIANETACEGETFDVFDNGRGYVVRMFEDGEFVETI